MNNIQIGSIVLINEALTTSHTSAAVDVVAADFSSGMVSILLLATERTSSDITVTVQEANTEDFSNPLELATFALTGTDAAFENAMAFVTCRYQRVVLESSETLDNGSFVVMTCGALRHTIERPEPFDPLEMLNAEIGNVNASTIAIAFNQSVTATGDDYSSGVTIKVNGSTAPFESGIRQTNHAIVYYALATPVEAGDTVTFDYDKSAGHIVAESGGAALADVSDAEVMNNVSGGVTLPQVASATLLLDLRASQLSLSDGDPVGTWPDASGNGRDFTQTGSARPTYRTINGHPTISFDGVDDWMLGDDWQDLDAPGCWAVVWAVTFTGDTRENFICKIANEACQNPGSTGWAIYSEIGILYQDVQNYIRQAGSNNLGFNIETVEIISNSEMHHYLEGVLDDAAPDGGAVHGTGVSNYSNHEPVRIGIDGANPPGDCDAFMTMDINAILIYKITDLTAWQATDRAAIEAWLTANT